MNTKKSFLMLFIALVLVLTSACGSAVETQSPTVDPAFIISIAETAKASVYETVTQIALSVPSETPTLFPTLTLEQTATPSPSSTSSAAMISVSKDTNCRLGPGLVYDRVGELGAGIMVEVFGLDPSRDYYLINNPSHPASLCWVWGFFATPVNSFADMPVYTPMHTPTPKFTPTQGGIVCALDKQYPLIDAEIKPGADISALWTLKNIGSFTWLKTEVDLKFIGSENGSFHNSEVLHLSDLTKDVAEGGKITINMDMTAPNDSGTYTENWALVDGSQTLCSMSFIIVVP